MGATTLTKRRKRGSSSSSGSGGSGAPTVAAAAAVLAAAALVLALHCSPAALPTLVWLSSGASRSSSVDDYEAGAAGPLPASAATAPAPPPLADNDKLAAVEELARWMRERGADVDRVTVRDAGPGAGLGLFAARDIRAGDVVLSLPTDLGFVGLAGRNGVMDFLLDYVTDLHDPSSPRARMWATMPRPDELRHLLNFPQEYLPLLQQPQLEEWLGAGLHGDARLFQRLHAPQLARANVTYADLTHALGLIGTRTFGRPHPADPTGGAALHYALPLLDMANHDNACPHANEFGPCAGDAARECVALRAGADVPAGGEVCLFYGHLLPDKALLEYGFLPPAAAAAAAGADDGGDWAAPLCGLDRHDFDADDPLPKLHAPPADFAPRDEAELAARAAQLEQRLALLRGGEARAREARPAPGDAGGEFLAQLREWRARRVAGVEAELGRLLALSRRRR